MDRRAWWAAVLRVAQSWVRLKWLSTPVCTVYEMLSRIVLICSIYLITSEVYSYGVASFQRAVRHCLYNFRLLKVSLHAVHCAALDTANRSFVLDRTISVKDFCSTLDLTVPLFWNIFTFISISWNQSLLSLTTPLQPVSLQKSATIAISQNESLPCLCGSHLCHRCSTCHSLPDSGVLNKCLVLSKSGLRSRTLVHFVSPPCIATS